MSEPIAFYFDFVSPFARIGAEAIGPVAARLGRDVVWRPVLIGVTILKVMGMKPIPTYPLKGPYLQRDLQRLSEWFGVPVRPHGLPAVNSLNACRAFLLLQQRSEEMAQRFGHAVFEALWREGRDITPAETVLAIAGETGCDAPALAAALGTDDTKALLHRATEAAMAAGVFGVPSFLADGELFWGNDHLWMLEHWLRTHGFAPVEGNER